MMEGNDYKDTVYVKNYLCKRDTGLLLHIYDNAEQLTISKTKELNLEIGGIYEKLKRDNKTSLSEDDEKIHEEFTHYTFHFNYLTLHSLFVSAYAIFENHLLEVSKQLETYSISRIKIKDMSKDKSVLDRVRRYLNLVHNLETCKSDNIHWHTIIKFQKIRNLIVHNGNKLKDDSLKASLKIFLKMYKSHMPQDNSFHTNNRQFLFDFNYVTAAYSDELYNDIYKIKST